MIYRGYSGYYKDVHLRSSLEFSYAYYLDHKNIHWEYELKTYDLNGTSYKPDFYIYDDKGSLVEIIEIKGEENKKEGEEKLVIFKELYSTPIRIISYKDLLKLYSDEMPISLNKSKCLWVNEYGAKLQQKVNGKLNPMYGKKHSAETKKKISLKSIERLQNPEFRLKMVSAIKEARLRTDYSHLRGIRVARITKQCPYCKNGFVVLETSIQKFCSIECLCRSNSKMAAKAMKDKAQMELLPVKEHIYEWTIQNNSLIQDAKYNQITSTLNDLFETIKSKFGIIDMRTVSKAVFGEDRGRKELLRHLKEIKI